MISMLCQKSNNGTITSTTNRDLFNFLIHGEPVKKPVELIRRESTFKNYLDQSSVINLVNIDIESKTDQDSEIRINKNVDFNDTKIIHTNRNKVHIKNKPESKFRLIQSSRRNRSSPATPPILITSNDVPDPNLAMSMEQFNVECFHREQKKLNRKKLKHVKTLLDNQINKSVTHKEIYGKLNEFLNEEHEFTQKINNKIEKSDAAELRKRELLYKNWHLNVYEPIQKEIQKNMNSSNADMARHIRNLKYLEYLQHVNKYGYAFQEDYEPTDYDPCDVVSLCANVPVKLKDPTTIRQRIQYKEDRTILKLITGKDFTDKQTDRIKLPLIMNDNESRGDLDWNSWLLDQYNNIESNVRTKSGKKCQPARYNSQYNLNWDRDLTLDTFVRSNYLTNENLTMQKN